MIRVGGAGRVARACCLALLLGAAAACSDATGGPAAETACADAEQRLGHRVCVHSIADAGTWKEIAYPTSAVDQERATTYLVPARDDARLPPVFVDSSAFDAPEESLHYKFLTESFPDFELLSYDEYLELVLDPARREWFAGNLTEYAAVDGETFYGMTVWDQGADPAGAISCDQFRSVYATVHKRLKLEGELRVVPANDLQRDTLADCELPVHDSSRSLDYEPYTQTKRCGTVRLYTLAELAVAEQTAEFGWQDVLVTDEAPLDIETVIAGIVTGSRQGELSHLNVRSAGRGTPNCYVKDAYTLLAKWEGQLVQLDCGPAGASIVAVTPDEAERCNAGLQPEPVAVIAPDLLWTELVPLLDLPTATVEERQAATARFGSKGTNLAVLYQRIDPALQLAGFLIPVHYYDAFMRGTSWRVDLGDGPEDLTFQQTLERLVADPVFRTDGAVRRERLAALQGAIEAASCDPALVAAIASQITTTFGSDEVMVRFRSSSNAEDAVGFNGAGLYDSTSVCLADEADADTAGPSRCDADHSNERDVCRGLTLVWGSLWNMKAYEERAWYGIDPLQVAMGILVDTRSKGELANIVAFSGNPLLRGDKRYLINAQLGELAVVAAEPGVWPEKDLLTLTDGKVTLIERVRGSTELPEGEWVLDDAGLRELGAELAKIVEVYPLDDEVPATARVMLDTEWKVQSDDRLVIKQVRPFID